MSIILVQDGLAILDESRNWPVCGGNKIRKLSYFLRSTELKGILTFGTKYSSHCLAAAYWGVTHNCPVRLLILDEKEPNFNNYPHLALSVRLGAKLAFVHIHEAHETISREKRIHSDYCWIPGGGHSREGLNAYRDWFSNIITTSPELRHREAVVLPYGTGTTALGILAAIREHNLSMLVVGISVSRNREQCLAAARDLACDADLEYLQIDDQFAGDYGERYFGQDELRLDFLRRTGILPDPIYNTRVIEYLQGRRVDNLIMIHTGGQLNNLLQ